MIFSQRLLTFSLLALFFLLPFERIPSLEWFGLTIRLSTLVLAVFVVYGLPTLIRSKRLGPLSSIDWVVLALLAAISCSLINPLDPERALVTFLILIFVCLGYLLVSRTARADQLRAQAINLVIISAVITGAFGFFQFFGDAAGLSTSLTGLTDRYTDAVFGFARLQSVGVEPLYYANFLLLPIFILVGRQVFGQLSDRRSLLTLGFLVAVFTLTLSRGAFLAGLAGLVVVIIVAIARRVSWRPMGQTALAILAGTLGALLCIGAVAGFQGIRTFGQQSTIVDAPVQSSTASRLDHYRQAWGIFLANPINGVGFGSYDAASQLPDAPEERGRQIVNNQYLETLAETGLIGFVALVLLGLVTIGKLLRRLRERLDPLTVALLAAFVGIIVQYNFFSTLYILFIWVVLGLIDSLPTSSQNPS